LTRRTRGSGPNIATFDHIMPRSKGGADTAENLQLVHARCNKIKGNKA